jgi:hypothetical protein
MEVEKREEGETRAHCLVTESDLEGWGNAKLSIMLTCRVRLDTLIHPARATQMLSCMYSQTEKVIRLFQTSKDDELVIVRSYCCVLCSEKGVTSL